MALDKAYAMFRGLGLRHLLVVPPPQSVVGIITRSDLLPHELERKLAGSQPAIVPGFPVTRDLKNANFDGAMETSRSLQLAQARVASEGGAAESSSAGTGRRIGGARSPGLNRGGGGTPPALEIPTASPSVARRPAMQREGRERDAPPPAPTWPDSPPS